MTSDRSDCPQTGALTITQMCLVPFSPVSLEADTPEYPVVCLQWDNCREHLFRAVTGTAEGHFPFCLGES